MNTKVSIYKEPVVLDAGETKESCDCGGPLTRSYRGDYNGYRATIHHCIYCTQDYYELRGKITAKSNEL